MLFIEGPKINGSKVWKFWKIDHVWGLLKLAVRVEYKGEYGTVPRPIGLKSAKKPEHWSNLIIETTPAHNQTLNL